MRERVGRGWEWVGGGGCDANRRQRVSMEGRPKHWATDTVPANLVHSAVCTCMNVRTYVRTYVYTFVATV